MPDRALPRDWRRLRLGDSRCSTLTSGDWKRGGSRDNAESHMASTIQPLSHAGNAAPQMTPRPMLGSEAQRARTKERQGPQIPLLAGQLQAAARCPWFEVASISY
jgi:hypothetical protein